MVIKQTKGTKNIVGVWIREFRKRNNLSLTQMADFLNSKNIPWDSNMVYKSENGTRKITDIEVRKLAETFELSPEILLSFNIAEDVDAQVCLDEVINTIDKVKIGKKLRYSREYKKYSLEKVASDCGVSTSYISELEAGVKTLSLPLCIKLCNLYECTPNYFLLGEFEFSELSDKINSLSKKKQDAMLNIIDIIVETH